MKLLKLLFLILLTVPCIHAQDNFTDTISLFQSYYRSSDTLSFLLKTDINNLFGKARDKEIYQALELIVHKNGELSRTWNARVRCRGNMRKSACFFPPLKIDFSKSDLDSLGYLKIDKLKLVLSCKSNSKNEQALFIEHTLYELYQLIDTLGFQTKIINVRLHNGEKEKYNLNAFLIEHEEDYAYRTGSRVLEKAIISTEALDRLSYLKMIFFQYMILNQDFSIRNKHNIEMIACKGEKRPRAIPYDFDYCGMVNQDYAIPAPTIPIDHVTTPYFRGKNVNLKEVSLMHEFYGGLRDDFEMIINDSDFLNESSKRSMLNNLSKFYKTLNNKKRWKHFCK